MAAIIVISLLFSLLCCTVHATVSYQVAIAPATNLHSIRAHPDKAAITVAQSGDNYAFSVVNTGPSSKVVQQQSAKAAAGPAVVQSTSTRHHVVAPATTSFVSAYGAVPVFHHQPLVAATAAHQPVAILHQSPTLVQDIVTGGHHVFRAAPISHQLVVDPIVHHPVPIPYTAAAHHASPLVHAGHVISTGHVVPTAHVAHVIPHSAPALLLAHHKK